MSKKNLKNLPTFCFNIEQLFFQVLAKLHKSLSWLVLLYRGASTKNLINTPNNIIIHPIPQILS